MPAFADLHEPLTGHGVQLRPAAERDIPEILIAHQDDPEMYKRNGLRRPPSGAELGRRVEQARTARAAGTALWLTILVPGSDECRGQLDVHDVDADHARGDLGIWVAPADRNRGLARGALRLAGEWLLRDCGLQRLQLFAEPDNEPVRRAAVAAGFTEEGVLRGYLIERGHRSDVAVMSLVTRDLA